MMDFPNFFIGTPIFRCIMFMCMMWTVFSISYSMCLFFLGKSVIDWKKKYTTHKNDPLLSCSLLANNHIDDWIYQFPQSHTETTHGLKIEQYCILHQHVSSLIVTLYMCALADYMQRGISKILGIVNRDLCGLYRYFVFTACMMYLFDGRILLLQYAEVGFNCDRRQGF